MDEVKTPIQRAASQDKTLHIIEGSNHMELYDIPKYVNEASNVLC